jgi:hypothetical protein
MDELNRQNDTSAAKTEIGFDYQFYYFFYLILDLRHGEKIGIEVKDDIHVDCADGSTVLIQTKHTLQTLKSGEPANLTERDKDLWKTLSNWGKIIMEQENPIDFIYRTTFQLVSNKGLTGNPFVVNLGGFCDGDINVKDFKAYLKELQEDTTDKTLKIYINDIRELRTDLLKAFAKKVDFRLGQDSLIDKIKKRLLEKIHISERVEDVYRNLHSELRDQNYLKVKAGERTEIYFEDLNKRFKQCFKTGLSTKLPLRDFSFSIPNYPERQLFIRHLVDIKDISVHDKGEIIEFTTQMLQLYNNLKTWEDDGDLLPSERKRFNKETILIWKNSFRRQFRRIIEKINSGENIVSLDDEIKYQAVELLDEMRKQILSIDETTLSMELSNGQFYLLTEQKQIGWHLNWKNRF